MPHDFKVDVRTRSRKCWFCDAVQVLGRDPVKWSALPAECPRNNFYAQIIDNHPGAARVRHTR